MTFQYTSDVTQNRPYTKLEVPILRNIWPILIAEELCSVQEINIPLETYKYPEWEEFLGEEDFLV